MKLAVVGSINMDMTVTAERIPLKGETLRGDSLHYIPGGKGANQAVAMAKLGAKVEMFGCVGDDANGTRLLENFKKVGVETGHIKVLEGVPTGIAMITVGENDNTIIVVPGANGKVDRDYIDRIKEELKTFDMVVLQQEIPLDTVYYVVDFCYDNQIPVVLNPAPASKFSISSFKIEIISSELIELTLFTSRLIFVLVCPDVLSDSSHIHRFLCAEQIRQAAYCLSESQSWPCSLHIFYKGTLPYF